MSLCVPLQVAIWCGWTHWLRTVVLKDKNHVCINLDETMVRHEYPSPKGNVVTPPRLSHRAATGCFQRVSRSSEKAGTTLMASVCDNDDLQPHLPQIWLPKDSPIKPMSRGLQDELRFALSDGYPQQVWGGTGGWMTTKIFSMVLITLVARVRERLGHDYAIVVIFDAAGSHANEEILQTARSLGIVVLLIPGQMTWLLQMLDVKVFGRLKARLRLDFMNERRLSTDGRMPTHRWATIAVCAVRDLLVNKTWQRAFDTMRIPSPDVPAHSFRRLQDMAPALSALPQMPMTPEQMDAMLGRHRLEMVPILFDLPIRLMPDEDRLALRYRLLADMPALPPPAPGGIVHRPLPALASAIGSGQSIAARVALRRRSQS